MCEPFPCSCGLSTEKHSEITGVACGECKRCKAEVKSSQRWVKKTIDFGDQRRGPQKLGRTLEGAANCPGTRKPQLARTDLSGRS